MADHDRIVLIDLGTDGEAAIVAVEDMIADRMGQYASGSAHEMLEQARALFRLHGDANTAIWTVVSGTKAQAIMVSRTSRPTTAIPLADFVADIERRRREAGIDELPRNTGNRRTASKRALLTAIEDAGGKW